MGRRRLGVSAFARRRRSRKGWISNLARRFQPIGISDCTAPDQPEQRESRNKSGATGHRAGNPDRLCGYPPIELRPDSLPAVDSLPIGCDRPANGRNLTRDGRLFQRSALVANIGLFADPRSIREHADTLLRAVFSGLDLDRRAVLDAERRHVVHRGGRGDGGGRKTNPEARCTSEAQTRMKSVRARWPDGASVLARKRRRPRYRSGRSSQWPS